MQQFVNINVCQSRYLQSYMMWI